jgi:hypothetical protein
MTIVKILYMVILIKSALSNEKTMYLIHLMDIKGN